MFYPSAKQLMVIENNVVSLMLFKKLFSKYFSSISTESSYGEMIARLVSGKLPDIILADADLSHVSGFELLHAIKQNKHLQHIPVILMSVSFTEKMITQAMKMGASACVTKPLSTSDYTSFCKDVHELTEETRQVLQPVLAG